jgi:hydroxymethylbilane synthase
VNVVLQRANPFDALLSREGQLLHELAAGSRVGSSSLRRQCQLRAMRPDLRVIDLRGNVNTRIGKLQDGEYEAIILACAGLERLGMQDLITQTLAPPDWLPASTQGTIGIQCRESDSTTQALLQSLNHAETAILTKAERGVAKLLQGSCQVPLAVFAQLGNGQLTINALVGEADGSRLLRSRKHGAVAELERVVKAVADDLLNQGAGEIIAKANLKQL